MPDMPRPDPYLLSTLICPVSGGILTYSRENSELVSPGARIAYPIRDGIPIMVPGEARTLTEDEIAALAGKRSGKHSPGK